MIQYDRYLCIFLKNAFIHLFLVRQRTAAGTEFLEDVPNISMVDSKMIMLITKRVSKFHSVYNKLITSKKL